jgi:SpoVK/Ycf46/Vps4 family AAA+-type ATPase
MSKNKLKILRKQHRREVLGIKTEFHFENSEFVLEIDNTNEEHASLPKILPTGCSFENIKNIENPILDFLQHHVRSWLIDYVTHLMPVKERKFEDLAQILIKMGISETFENLLLQIGKSETTLIQHFIPAILEKICEQQCLEMTLAQTKRDRFNCLVGSNSEKLLDIELRFLAGALASVGHFNEFIEVDDIDFICNSTFGTYRNNHFSDSSVSLVADSLAPTSRLLTEFYLDPNFEDINREWDRTDIFVGTFILNKLPNHGGNNKINRFRRGYEIREDLPELSDVVLETDIKDKINNILNLYEYQLGTSKNPCLRLLFRGLPGSGKSMLSRAIAKRFKKKALIVNLSTLRTSSPFLVLLTFIERAKKNNYILILEECESLISSNPFKGSSDESAKLIFEEYEGVVIFTTNVSSTMRWFAPTEGIERRMDLIVDFEMPTPQMRKVILANELAKWALDGWQVATTEANLTELAQDINLSGGFYPQAIKLAAASDITNQIITFEALQKSMEYFEEKTAGNAKKTNLNYSEIELAKIVLKPSEKNYVEKIVARSKVILTERKRDPLLPMGVTALFSGPPGTGKTITAKAIANELGLKIRIAKPSDFLGSYVGETERNIASIFRDAERKKYLLFIDEAEGLLPSRERAQRSWEITQIDEFLQAVENFKGVLICATNHSEYMDFAFARRFLFHLQFSVPTVEERFKLWLQYLGYIKLPLNNFEQLAAKYALSGGEIRNVAVKTQIMETHNFSEIEKLCIEIQKHRTGMPDKRIGFDS